MNSSVRQKTEAFLGLTCKDPENWHTRMKEFLRWYESLASEEKGEVQRLIEQHIKQVQKVETGYEGIRQMEPKL